MKKSIYLFASGTLQRQDNSLVYITKNNKNYLPIYQIETIYIFGSCTLNKTVIQILNEYNITICFFSYYGNYIGCYLPRQKQIGKITLAQILLFQDVNQVFNYQKEIILTSIHNMLSVIKYYQKKRSAHFSQIKLLESLAEEVKNLDYSNQTKLLILEARSKQIYYSSFNLIINNHDFDFEKRTTYPPKDYINAIMSYGYAILYGVVETSLYCSHLLPHLGFIHGQSQNENSLKYDLADIFKPILVDRLIFRLINKKQLTKEYFISKNDGIYLSKEGCILFIENWNELLKATITINNKKLSYRSIIKKEVYKIERSIIGKEKYKGYRMEW